MIGIEGGHPHQSRWSFAKQPASGGRPRELSMPIHRPNDAMQAKVLRFVEI